MFKSEHGQDKFVIDYFREKKNGTYFECGAYNGIDYSNTYALHKLYNWHGLLIEGNPKHYESLKNNRHDDFTECCIVSGVDRRVVFSQCDCDGWSGIEETFPDAHCDRIEKHGFKLHRETVTARSINSLLEKYKMYAIDYFSLDVEGHEYDIIAGLNTEKYKIELLEVENQFGNLDLHNCIKHKGFSHFKRVEINDFYRRVV